MIINTRYTTIAAVLALSSLACAGGDTSKGVIEPPVYMEDTSKGVIEQPSPYSYFTGGAAGYLNYNETEFYSAHVGVDLSNSLYGWNRSIYAEVGFASINGGDREVTPNGTTIGNDFDFDLVPITFNYKLERSLNPKWKFYGGAGAGIALIDSEYTDYSAASESNSSDEVFYAQAFAGTVYQISHAFEIFAGFRYIYFDEPSGTAWKNIEATGDVKNSDWLLEIGARYNF